MTDAAAVRVKRGRVAHATRDYRVTLCGKPCDGCAVDANCVPTCKACLRVLLGGR